MLRTTPYKFIWRLKDPWKYYADTVEEVKYVVFIDGEKLGYFMGVNRTFDYDFYYVNYINADGEYEDCHIHKDTEIVLVKKDAVNVYNPSKRKESD